MSLSFSAPRGGSRSADLLPPEIDAVIDRALAQKRLVGAVVLIQWQGRAIYRRAAGFANREAARPMREDTLFRLASVSKPIVCVAAMVLVGQGRLQLDEAVVRWLPRFQPRLPDGSTPRITLRQLLSHTAGLGYRFLEADENGPYARAGVSDGMDCCGISLAENLRRLAGVPLLYAPGTAWGYSLATDVLGAVVEAACDMPLDQAVRTLVSTPLGMRDTDFHAVDAERLAPVYVNDTPLPHRMDECETVSAFEGTVGIRFDPARAFDAEAFHSGGAGMVGSAPDLLRLLETLRAGGAPLLSSSLVEQMGTNQTANFGPPDAPGFGFGLGFSVLRDAVAAASPEALGTWRWGGAYGHSWFVDPRRALCVVAFTNTLYEGMCGGFVRELRDAVYRALDLGSRR